jgi:thiamine-phosphate pyrophosphorylase
VKLVAITDRAVMGSDVRAAIERVLARFGRDDVLVQVREKDLDGGLLLALVRSALATGARVVVNDRVDVALAAGAHGVHLPERGLAIADARALLGPHALIGASRHDLAGVAEAAAAGANFIQLGPIWPSPGKGEPLGTDALARAREVIAGRAQLVAVGGIDSRERADAALAAGADVVAAIRWLWGSGVELA